MKRIMIGLLAIAATAQVASAASGQKWTVQAIAAASAVAPSCTCTTNIPEMNYQHNRRSAQQYGHMFMSWNCTNAQSVSVTFDSSGQSFSGNSGTANVDYSGMYGYFYGHVHAVGKPNDLGEVASADADWGQCYTFLSCFPAGTKITVLDAKGNATYKNIEDVTTDDTVLAWDPATQSFVSSKVTQPVKTKATGLFEFKTADGNDLKITPTHEMYVEGKGFIASENVKVGDVLVTAPDGAKVKITSIESIPGNVDVYNLITDDPHDFFAQNILVHNENDPGHKDHGFISGTIIQTLRGPVPIEDVKVGDKLISVDPANGKLVINTVRKTDTQQVTKTIKINGMRMGTQQPLFLAKKLAMDKKPAAK